MYLGKKLVASRKASTSVVMGTVEGVSTGTNASITGWACSSGLATSIDVHLYVGGPAGTGSGIGASTANLTSEDNIQAACHSSGTKHRFSIPITEAQRQAYAGQSIYIHGISPVGGENALLTGSGSFVVPPSVSAPAAPASATTAVSGDLSVLTVSWAASANASSYTLERSWNGEPWPSVYEGPALSVSLPVAVDGNYVFRVKACNAYGCSEPTVSNTVTVAHVPSAPASVSAPSTSTGAVGLSWGTATYATSYEVEHSQDGTWVQVYAGNATSATISEPATGNWYYRVRGCNANGCGGYATSGVVIVTLPPVAAPSISGGGTSSNGAWVIAWSGVAGATSYNLMEAANGGGLTTVQNSGNTSWATSGRGNGTYIYQVQACNAGGCGPFSGQVGITVSLLPPIPGTVHMSDTVQGKRETYTLLWEASPGATRYEILRVQTNAIINAGAALSYPVESGFLPYDLKYSYRVRACNDQGCSAWSEEDAG